MNENLQLFEILARQNETMLTAYIRGIVHDATLADDVAQATWIIAWKKIPELRDPAAFPAWLRTIARFEALNMLRKRKREALVEFGEMEETAEAFSRWETAAGSGRFQNLVAALEDCYDQLPDALRTVCRQHYFQNRRAHEIAGEQGLETPAVLKRLQRCREALRLCLRHKFPNLET